MTFDFKKEYKEFYMPKNKPEIVNVPKANYIAVRGKGNPNEEGGAYQQAIGVLYAVAYTLKMSYKTDYKIEGFYEYVVPPLEGFWWQEGIDGVDYTNKSAFNWISVIRLPDFVSKEDFEWAVETASKKKKLDCSSAEYITIDEGLCVQIMHLGPFDDEPEAVALMDAYLEQNGYVNDMNKDRLHHEIYLSDARKVAPEKWKTVIRHPIKKQLRVNSVVGNIVTITVDRPLGSYHPKHKDIYYPINYGYVEGIMAPDGEEQDVYILGVDGPVEKFTGTVIAVIHRNDDVEEKWVVASTGMTFTKEEIRERIHFQEQYFDSEIMM